MLDNYIFDNNLLLSNLYFFMHKAFLVKLYPNKTQQSYLDKNFGCARFVYNKMLEINMKVYNRRGKYVSKY